jgi:hypothetical protein
MTKKKTSAPGELANVSRAPAPAVVTPRDWANAEGRHGLDAYFEDQMTLRAQGVDVESDRSCRAYVMHEGTPEERVEVLGSRENAQRVGSALMRGVPVVGRPVVRPDEEMLGQLMTNAPLPVFASGELRHPPRPQLAAPKPKGRRRSRGR